MLITSHTPQEKAMRDSLNREMLALNNQRYIRTSFDGAITTSEAQSWITIAMEQGYFDMALEMADDLKTEIVNA